MKLRALAIVALVGCAHPVSVTTAAGFVEIDTDLPSWAYRAATADGVVVGVRVVDASEGDLAFWTRAVTAELRDGKGYALRDARPLLSQDGVGGTELRFEHDQGGRRFAYWVALFPRGAELVVAEAGGVEASFERARPSVESMLASVQVR